MEQVGGEDETDRRKTDKIIYIMAQVKPSYSAKQKTNPCGEDSNL